MAHAGRPRKHEPRAEEIRQLLDSNSSDRAIAAIQGSSIELQDGDARTPLVNAAIVGNIRVLTWLLDNDADMDSQDRDGCTALHFAVQEKHAEIIEMLLDGGADVGLTDSHGNAPLWRAVFDARGNYEFVRLLLRHGANPHAKNESDRSPMDFAQTIEDVELVALLAES
ncbi:MAG: ankyrin repeat domain-containing protein [Gammaproteobacteria bacterium]|nr:ankyrin repeat domain-containing protein [Gammaproteobacteria bacterium]